MGATFQKDDSGCTAGDGVGGGQQARRARGCWDNPLINLERGSSHQRLQNCSKMRINPSSPDDWMRVGGILPSDHFGHLELCLHWPPKL